MYEEETAMDSDYSIEYDEKTTMDNINPPPPPESVYMKGKLSWVVTGNKTC